MTTVDNAPCPRCQAPPGVLSVSVALVLSDASEDGTRLTARLREAPVLACSACGMRKIGVYDDDCRHVTFPPDR